MIFDAGQFRRSTPTCCHLYMRNKRVNLITAIWQSRTPCCGTFSRRGADRRSAGYCSDAERYMLVQCSDERERVDFVASTRSRSSSYVTNFRVAQPR
jgi:hypothetical protein